MNSRASYHPDFSLEVTRTDHGPSIKVHGTATALVVEDNPVMARVLSCTLTKMGFSVRIAFDGKQALEALQMDDYDLVLMDCDMPVMDGLEATFGLRHSEAETNKHTLVIGYSADCDRRSCLAAGMDDFLPKPASASCIAEKISHWYGSQVA